MKKLLSSVVAASMLASAFAGFSLTATAAATQSGSLTLNFDDGASKFTAANRTTCTVANGEQVITAASNAGNQYGLAYYDFSSVSAGADEVVVEFDSRILSGTRYWISLYDTSRRGTEAGGSSKATYNTTGLIYTMGLGNDSNLYQVMGVNVSDSTAALDNTIPAKVTVSFVNNTMDYTVTTASGTTLSSGIGKAFSDTSAAQCTGIEFYTWANNSVGYIDNLTVKAYTYDTVSVTADKTAQWSAQEIDPTQNEDDPYDPYDLRIHGYPGWETAAYIGFTLPSSFSPSKLKNATLILDTISASASGTAYIYAADYSAFDNNTQYGGTKTSPAAYGSGPAYTETEFKSFENPVDAGEFSIDITEYIKTLDAANKNIAFRIDVKNQDECNNWVIGSCNNGGAAPVLKLDYSEPLIKNQYFTDGTDGWTISDSSAMTVSGGLLTSTGASKLSQTLTNVPNGTYNLTADLTNTSASGVCYLYAKAPGHTMARTAVPVLSSSTKIIVPSIKVDNGTLEIGLYADGTQTVTADNFAITETESTRVPFLIGGEVSKLTYIEDKGAAASTKIAFHNEGGTEMDGLQVLAENGFNLARIRVLNNPGKDRGNGDNYLPAGYQNLEDCLTMAKRAKEKGMQIELTIAYSDWWTDGGEQFAPNDWTSGASGLTGDALANYYAGKIADYTREVLTAMNAQETSPAYVSIGNEMQLGMCFGQFDEEDATKRNELYNNPTYLAQLVKAGAAVVRELAPKAKIILHTDNGGKVLTGRPNFVSMLSKLSSDDYDVIGVSYYPYYNSDVSIDNLVTEFNSMIATYNKDVIVMETGYNWSEKRGDGEEGQLWDNGYYQSTYGESIEGQRAYLTELYAKLKNVSGGRCLGVLYWDPIMLYDQKQYVIGWAMHSDSYGDWTDANVVSNSNLFSFDSKALSSQKAMLYNTNADAKVLVSGTISTTTTGNRGQTTTAPVTNTEVTLTVNGTNYDTTTDAYGQYIVAIDYPATEKISVSASGYSGSYYEAAPAEGVLLSGIDFPSSATVTAPAYNNDMTVKKTYTTEQGYIGNATSLTFSITPNNGVSGMFVTDDAGHKVEYDFSDDG
ncbi:MAG: glycosyl hydrolase 53 family protein, partial [Candidatus Ornithomonoglobus sp.]